MYKKPILVFALGVLVVSVLASAQSPQLTGSSGTHDLAITDVTVSQITIPQGLSSEVNVTVANQGNYTEHFNASVYCGRELAEPFIDGTGLVGYWKFDEGNGTTTYDSSGNNNTGILINGVEWADGKFNKSLRFDGIDDNVQITDSPSLRVQSFTLATWVYMTQRPYDYSGGVHVAMVNKLRKLDGLYYGYKLSFERPSSTNDDLVIAIGDGSAQRFLIRYNSIHDLTLNQWHLIVGTFNGNVVELYIDNDLKATSGPIAYSVVNDEAPLGIGQQVIGAPGHFKGLVDSVLIFSRALSAEEIFMQYYARHLIQTQSMTLQSDESATISVGWNTAGLDVGEYIIVATIVPVINETDLTDNLYLFGTVTIIWNYDITLDGYCGIDDIVAVAEHFGESEP